MIFPMAPVLQNPIPFLCFLFFFDFQLNLFFDFFLWESLVDSAQMTPSYPSSPREMHSRKFPRRPAKPAPAKPAPATYTWQHKKRMGWIAWVPAASKPCPAARNTQWMQFWSHGFKHINANTRHSTAITLKCSAEEATSSKSKNEPAHAPRMWTHRHAAMSSTNLQASSYYKIHAAYTLNSQNRKPSWSETIKI